MQLYCNGDSFVSGCELADDILPDYPGLLPWPPHTKQHELHKEWLRKSHSSTFYQTPNGRGNKSSEINRLELERAFPNKVHNMTGIPVINRALSGGSMDNIVRNSITDLYNLKKENPNKQIIACVGTTYPGRWEIANDQDGQHDLHKRPQDWICISGIYSTNADSDYMRDMRKYKAIYEKDYHQLVNFYKNIVLLQDFCKLNELDLPIFIYDCLEKGYIQNKWGKSPMDSIKKNVEDVNQTTQTPKKKSNRKKKEELTPEPIEQKKSEPVKQTPINDLYGED